MKPLILLLLLSNQTFMRQSKNGGNMFEINTCLCVIVKGLYCISKNSTEKSIMLNPELQPDQNMAPMLFVASLVMYIFIIKLD